MNIENIVIRSGNIFSGIQLIVETMSNLFFLHKWFALCVFIFSIYICIWLNGQKLEKQIIIWLHLCTNKTCNYHHISGRLFNENEKKRKQFGHNRNNNNWDNMMCVGWVQVITNMQTFNKCSFAKLTILLCSKSKSLAVFK